MARSMALSAVGWEWVLLLQEMSSSEAQMMLTEMIKSFDMVRTLQKAKSKCKGDFAFMRPSCLVCRGVAVLHC